MSANKKKSTAPKLPTTIVKEDWKKGEIRFSKKWKDSFTNKPGSAYYFIPTGQRDVSSAQFKTDDGSNQSFGFTRNFFAKPEERDNLPVLQFDGGRPIFEMLKEKMPELMINCNKDYNGKFYMTVEQYNKYINDDKVVPSDEFMTTMDTSSPS